MMKTKMTKQQMAPILLRRMQATRVRVLERAITRALKDHMVRLASGSYMDDIGTPEACVCAIGATLLSRAKTPREAKQLQKRIDKAYTLRSDYTGAQYHPERKRKALMRWAAKLVNDGITAQDLIQLEVGFEGALDDDFSTTIALAEPDKKSPFYKLGVKLARRVIRKQAKEQPNA